MNSNLERIFLLELIKKHRKINNTKKDKDINSSIITSVKQYIKHQLNSGALMITGEWGCGKTYFFKNELPPIIQDYTFIHVSLFGLSDLKELPERIFTAFLDTKSNHSLKIGTLSKKAKNLAKSLPIISKYVDLNQLIGRGEGLYKIIPSNKTVICLDDLERISTDISIENALGTINDLVENKGYKVILIANEKHIKKEENNIFLFKEKVVEKTLEFTPDIPDIFKSLIKSCNNTSFTEFMSCDVILRSINPYDESVPHNSTLRKNLSNIRILKFALNHFYEIYQTYEEGKKIEKWENTSFIEKQLTRYWFFVLGVSIEYKMDRLSNQNNYDIDKYWEDLHEVIGNTQFSEPSQIKIDKNLSDANEIHISNFKFCSAFYNCYFLRISAIPIYNRKIYLNLITGTPKIDYIDLNLKEEKTADELLKEVVYETHEYTNENFFEDINKLISHIKNAYFKSYSTYTNIAYFLHYYKDIYGMNEGNLKILLENAIKKTINGCTLSEFEIPSMKKKNSDPTQPENPSTKFRNELFQKSQELYKKRIEEEKIACASELEILFKEDLSKFILKTNELKEKFLNLSPSINNINKNVILDKLNNTGAKEVLKFISFIRERYSTSAINQISPIKEKPFIESIRYAIENIAYDKIKLSHHYIRKRLEPVINNIEKNI